MFVALNLGEEDCEKDISTIQNQEKAEPRVSPANEHSQWKGGDKPPAQKEQEKT